MVRTLALLAVGLLAAGCGDGAFLSDEGPGVRWVAEASAPPASTSTTTTSTEPPPPIVPAGGLGWWNDPLELLADEEVVGPDRAIGAVWAASSRTDRYVQVAVDDLLLALPGLTFPGMVPDDTEWVTSQLVFAPSTGSLAEDQVAAFGMWSEEPYTSPRAQAQRAVLAIAYDDIDRAALALDPENGCAWFRARDVIACNPGPADLGPSWWIDTFEGPTLVWLDGLYRYELRVRGLPGSVAEAMARSMVPLDVLRGAGPVSG
ncbi:MAG: hypothetical protein JSV07_06460 [Acidimicrobiia bacterium]|nr:MAG: hypothetical protein JSV07_06460 [Acidimicrobiia bacterium]